MTKVTIRLDNAMVLAVGTLPGKWPQDMAIAEFKRNPGKFTVQSPFDSLDMIGIARGVIKPYQVFTVLDTPAVAA